MILQALISDDISAIFSDENTEIWELIDIDFFRESLSTLERDLENLVADSYPFRFRHMRGL